MFQRWIHAHLSVPIGRITARKSATKLTPTVTAHVEKMKTRLIIISLIVLFGCNLKEQNLKKDYSNYLSSLNDSDYKNSLSFIPTKLFEIVSKDKIIEQLDFVKNEYGKLHVDSLSVTEIKPMIEFHDTLYTKVNYSAIIVLNLKQEKINRAEALLDGFEKKYSKNSIRFDKKNLEFRIRNSSSFYGISADRGNNWKFLENLHESIYSRIIPSNVLTELNEK